MTIPHPDPLLCDDSQVSQQSATSAVNVFEGPEKKLEVHFTRLASVRSTRRRLAVDTPHTLRALTRCDIESILRAAACTILSVTRNEYTDAYLLSESSLFVSDTRLTVKTCGTTRLLHALPVILKLVSAKLQLAVSHVQFSRVSYLFPHAQLFPHDSFENEVSYLDKVLNSKGQVFEAPMSHSSTWYMYYAVLPIEVDDADIEGNIEVDKEASISGGHEQALEMYMFHLDPSAMKQFMYEDRPHMFGSDDKVDGTTRRAGIDKLLLKDAMIDAFNFEPCGYSMNALLGRSYYTLHITPEPGASYVSFETTAPHRHVSRLVDSVVTLFKPEYFTVALIQSPEKNLLVHGRDRKFHSKTAKTLAGQSFHGEAAHVFMADEGCHAIVSSFTSKPSCSAPSNVGLVANALPTKEETGHSRARLSLLHEYRLDMQ